MDDATILPSASELSADSAPAAVDPQDAMRRKLSAIYQEVKEAHAKESTQKPALSVVADKTAESIAIERNDTFLVNVEPADEACDCLVWVNGAMLPPDQYMFDGKSQLLLNDPLMVGDCLTIERRMQKPHPKESPVKKRRKTTSKMVDEVLNMYEKKHLVSRIQEKMGIAAGTVYSILKGELLIMTPAQKKHAARVYGGGGKNPSPSVVEKTKPAQVSDLPEVEAQGITMKKSPKAPMSDSKVKAVVEVYEERITQLEGENRRLRTLLATLMLRE